MNRPVQLKITDEELWGEAPAAATFENVQVGYELLVLSYGIGQDSWALLVKWAEDPEFRAKYPTKRFLVISAETGNEHDETYQHLEYTKRYCEDHEIEYVHITPDLGYHSPNWQYLHHLWDRKHFPKHALCALRSSPSIAF